MTTPTKILTDEQLKAAAMRPVEESLLRGGSPPDIFDSLRSVEQAVLQSPEVVAMRRDAERFQKIASHTYEIKRTHKRDTANRVRRLQLDIRNHTPSPSRWLEEAVDDLDAAMQEQKT